MIFQIRAKRGSNSRTEKRCRIAPYERKVGPFFFGHTRNPIEHTSEEMVW